VPEWPGCAKNFLQKAQSPGIRGFGVFGFQVFISDAEVSCVGSMPNAGSWCLEAVHSIGSSTKQLWELACLR
jgi:hypothetical protein